MASEQRWFLWHVVLVTTVRQVLGRTLDVVARNPIEVLEQITAAGHTQQSVKSIHRESEIDIMPRSYDL